MSFEAGPRLHPCCLFCAEDKPLQMVAARDMGLAAATVFQAPGEWAGKAFPMAADQPTPREMCDAFAAVQVRSGGRPPEQSTVLQGPELLLPAQGLAQRNACCKRVMIPGTAIKCMEGAPRSFYGPA
jgi:hypothetical protein